MVALLKRARRAPIRGAESSPPGPRTLGVDAFSRNEIDVPRAVHRWLALEKSHENGCAEAASYCAEAANFAVYHARYIDSGVAQGHFACEDGGRRVSPQRSDSP